MATGVGAESERWCIVLVVVEHDGSLVLVVEPTRVAVPCPRGGELSRRQHSRYQRHPLDLPWRGKVVRIRGHSRRWFCDAASCSRRIFAERFDGALARYARRTNGATELLTTFALQAGREGGARLARKVGVPIGPDTLLRILHLMSEGENERAGDEAVWVPTALLPRYGVNWTAEDNTHLTARCTVDDTPLVVRYDLDDEARFSAEIERWGHPNNTGTWHMQAFGFEATAHGALGGVSIPSQVRMGVGWFPHTEQWASGEFFRFALTSSAW